MDQVISTGVARRFYSTRDFKPASKKYLYGSYFKMEKYIYFLTFDSQKWYKLRNTLLWLGIYGKEWDRYVEERTKVKKALFKLGFEDRLFLDENKVSWTPIKLELEAEEDKVIESIMEQINEINNVLDEYYQCNDL